MERLVREVLTASRFFVVGSTATLVHLSVSFFALKLLATPVAAANFLGFAVALFVSYVGHYYFTFKSEKQHGVSAVRFLATASTAYVANVVVVSLLAATTLLEPEVRLAAGIATMPVVSFILSRLWVY